MPLPAFAQQKFAQRPKRSKRRKLPDKPIQVPITPSCRFYRSITVIWLTMTSCATRSRNIAPTLSWMMNSSENTSA